MLFKDRFEAGKILANRLLQYKGKNCIVLAIPRGGIQIGYAVAENLDLPLEPVLVKKIGHPLNPELAIGAVGLQGEFLDPRFDISKEFLKEEIARLRKLLRERQEIYLRGKKPSDLKGWIVILVDNGIATGSTALAAIAMIRKQNPAKIVVAIPVAPPSAVKHFQEKADEVVCLYAPDQFMAVGQFYEHFDQVEDEEAIELLEQHNLALKKTKLPKSA